MWSRRITKSVPKVFSAGWSVFATGQANAAATAQGGMLASAPPPEPSVVAFAPRAADERHTASGPGSVRGFALQLTRTIRRQVLIMETGRHPLVAHREG